MKISDFKLECYFGKYEFTAPYLLTQSDCESMKIQELLAMEPGSHEAFLNMQMGYTQTWGDPELRQLISQLYTTMTSDDILVFHGAQEGIFAYMNVMLNPGDHMISLYPTYQSSYEVSQSIPNCSFSKWFIHDDGEKWYVDFDELEALIQPNTKLIAITTPDHPTGFTFTNEEIAKLALLAEKYGLFIFSDEVYKGLELDGEKRNWMADYTSKAASLGVMSKAYGLAGLRVGWIACKDHALLEKIVKFKHYLSICDSCASEFLSKVALRNGDAILNRNLTIIKQNMSAAYELFVRHPHVISPRRQHAGPVAFHKLLLPTPVEEFCQEAVDKKGVLLLPSSIYEMEGNYFRMGYGRLNVKESLAVFEEFLQEKNL